MAKKMSDSLQIWIDARKKFHLSHAHIQMARELGMNPKKFGSLANHKQERWKAPLPEFIEEIYFKRFGRTRPERVMTIKELSKEKERKKEERKRNKNATEENGAELSRSHG
jgi:hypothetical protein